MDTENSQDHTVMSLPSYLNEDGVPLDEKDIENIWHNYAIKAGLYATHLENMNTPLPDHMFVWKGLVLFHEMKLRRGNLIYFQHYQWANLIRMRHSMHPWQLNVVVYYNSEFSGFSIDQIKERDPQIASHGKVKANIDSLEPLYTVSNAYEFDLYLEWVKSKAWKKKT